jgi:transposase-like protein
VLKRIVTPIAIGGVLLIGATSAGFASSAYASTPAATSPVQSANHGVGAWVRSHRRQIAHAVVTISAKTIGVSDQSLVSDLRSGKSIAEVANDHGVSTQTVVNALVTAADAAVGKAVTDHKLTSAQATKIEAVLPGRATKVVKRVF